MKKNGLKSWFYAAGLGSIMAVSGGGMTFAQDVEKNGNPEFYSMKLYEVTLCDDLECTNRTVLATSTQRYDFASVSEGGAVGSMGAGQSITLTTGTYPYVMLKIDNSLGTRGRVSLEADKDCISAKDTEKGTRGIPLGEVVAKDTGTPADSYEAFPTAAEFIETEGTDSFAEEGFKVTFGAQYVTAVIKLKNAITITSVDELPEIAISINVTNRLLGVYYTDDDAQQRCGIASDAPKIYIKFGSEEKQLIPIGKDD